MQQTVNKETITKERVTFAAVACCTFERLRMLEMTLLNLKKLKVPQGIKVEVLVIDNDKKGSARSVIEKVSEHLPFKINYFVEEQRGLSSARNRLLKEAIEMGASHVAIFDDDGLVDSDWLLNHITAYNEHPAARIVAGPEFTYFDGDFPSYFTDNNIFVKSTTKKKGEIRPTCSTNNSFFPVSIASKEKIWFDPAFVFMGGEDGDFFWRASEAGYQIVYNPDAVVREIADESRVNLKWILHRCMYNGYSGSYLKFKSNSNTFKRSFYIFKLLIVTIADVIFLPFALLGGLTFFFNIMGLLSKNIGKLLGAVFVKPVNYYQYLNGGINK